MSCPTGTSSSPKPHGTSEDTTLWTRDGLILALQQQSTSQMGLGHGVHPQPQYTHIKRSHDNKVLHRDENVPPLWHLPPTVSRYK